MSPEVEQLEASPRPAEIVISDQQAGLLAAAADTTLRADAEGQLVSLEDNEREALKQLAVFMTLVNSEPGRFPVTGRMASVKTHKHRPTAGNTAASTRNKRKDRQERRARFSQLRRKNRRAQAEAFNQAREIMEREMEEGKEAQAELVARLEAEPKFQITDAYGNIIMSGIPQSMVVPLDPPMDADDLADAVNDSRFPDGPPPFAPEPETKIIMPGSAEALQAQIDRKSF